MKSKTWPIIILAVIVGAGWMVLKKAQNHSAAQESIKIISPSRGDIKIVISTTGTVLPKNRLQIKPPVNGRVEEVLVKEGQNVKVGEILAWMSSTDRAVLLDAARGRGEAALKEWQDVYKPIPLVSPINGEVIVGTIQPGQAVTTVDDIVVLSDRLIVRAQVDETDIGKIENGQNAVVSLDAYMDVKINGVVDHVYYESKTVNNVTIYDVDLLMTQIPPFFRSGMNANIDFVIESKKDVLLLPLSVVRKDTNGSSVMLSQGSSGQTINRIIQTGLADERNVEIVSGITQSDSIVMNAAKYSPLQATGSSPFMPSRKKK